MTDEEISLAEWKLKNSLRRLRDDLKKPNYYGAISEVTLTLLPLLIKLFDAERRKREHS